MKELINISSTNVSKLPQKILGTTFLGATLLLSACAGGASTEASTETSATPSSSVSSSQNLTSSGDGKTTISSAGLARAADPDAYMKRFITVTKVDEETPSPEPSPTDLVEQAVTLPEEQPTESETPLPELPTGTPNTVSFLGVTVPIYTGLLGTVSEEGISDPNPNREVAPDDSAGIYAGTNLSVWDNSGVFLVGNNPGPFEKVLELQVGDTVNLVDETGKARDFVIQEIFRVDPNGISLVDPSISYYDYITDMSSEKLILQTSENDKNTDIRIIVATPVS